MKKLLIIALAMLLALSLCACKDKNPGNEEGSGNTIIDINPPAGTGSDNENSTGDPSVDTNNQGGTDNPGTPVEETFTDLEQTVFIVTSAANIRSEAYISESNIVGHAKQNDEFKSTGYSENWYRIEYVTEVEVTAAEGEEPTTETQTLTCYVSKRASFIKDTTAVELEEPMTVYILATALYVRSYYDFEAEDNLMFTLAQGDEVTAIAKGNGWYKIRFSDDKDGNPVYGYISANEKYVSTTKPEETTTAEEATTEAAE